MMNCKPVVRTWASVLLLLVLYLGSLSWASAEDEIVMDFAPDTDIREVIAVVSKHTGKNFIVDPRVKGKVTFFYSSKINGNSLYEIFLSILKVHGFIAVPTGHNVVKILPNAESRTEAGLIEGSGKTADSEIALRVFQIENGQAVQMIPILRPLISRNGHIAAHPDSNNIVVSDTRKSIEKILKVIEKMDTASQSAIRMVKLKNATATDLLAVLNPMLADNKVASTKTGRGSSGGVSGGQQSIVADERTNSILVKADAVNIEEIVGLIKRLDKPVLQTGSGDTAVVKLRYAKAKNIVEILTKLISADNSKNKNNNSNIKDGAVFGDDKNDVQVSMDEKANSIIIIGSAGQVARLKKLVHTIDAKRSQVMVEALIVEITANKSKQLGVQWGAAASSYGVSGSSVTASVGSLIGAIKGGNNITFAVLAEALAKDADTNLISAPSLMTMENEEAEIEIGREVPLVTGNYTSTGTTSTVSNPFQTITRENIGLKLKITPQINKGEVIRLKVEQEFSNILPDAKTTLDAVDVVTSKRILKTNVLVDNGSILVLGGLIDDSVNESENRVTGASKIPLLGRLFRHRETSKEKRNLMIFIRPYIVDDEHSATKLTKNRYNYIRNIQQGTRQRGVQLMPNEKQPLIRNIYNAPQPRQPVYRKKPAYRKVPSKVKRAKQKIKKFFTRRRKER